MNISEETDLRITWLIAIVLGGIMLYQGLRGLVEGSPTREWITPVVVGLAILLTYIMTEVSHRLDGDQPSSNQFGLSDWTGLLLTAGWVVMGALFYVSEVEQSQSVGLIVAFFGAIGFAGVLYKRYRIRNR